MFVLLLVVVGVLVFVVAAVAAGAGSSMAAAHPDRPGPYLPDERAVRGADVDRVRFSIGLRGYRMDEVDDVLDRLSVELAGRDARIGELEQELSTRTSPSDGLDRPDDVERATSAGIPAADVPAADVPVPGGEATEPVDTASPTAAVSPGSTVSPVEPAPAPAPESAAVTADAPSVVAEQTDR